jgi:hypothetical protein
MSSLADTRRFLFFSQSLTNQSTIRYVEPPAGSEGAGCPEHVQA